MPVLAYVLAPGLVLGVAIIGTGIMHRLYGRPPVEKAPPAAARSHA